MWRKGRIAVTRKFFAAFAAGEVAACAALFHPDIRYLDTRGNAIEGREACVELLRRLFAQAGGVRIEVDSIADRGEYALARGRTASGDEQMTGEVLWRVRTEGSLVSEVEAYRPDGLPTVRLLMPEYLAARQARMSDPVP